MDVRVLGLDGSDRVPHRAFPFTMATLGIAIESYATLRRFLNQAEQADKTKLVFERKSGEK